MTITICPECGKIITTRFPLHDCKPAPNFRRSSAAAAKSTKPQRGGWGLTRKQQRAFNNRHED